MEGTRPRVYGYRWAVLVAFVLVVATCLAGQDKRSLVLDGLKGILHKRDLSCCRSLLLMGRISGIAFIFGMDALKAPGTGSMAVPLAILIALMAVGAVLCTQLRESPLMAGSDRVSSSAPTR